MVGAAESETPAADWDDGAFGRAREVLCVNVSGLGPLGIAAVNDAIRFQKYQIKDRKLDLRSNHHNNLIKI